MFNLSLKRATFPKLFEYAIVKPLFKSGVKNKVSHYRPILLLSCFFKIFEKLLKKYNLILTSSLREDRSIEDSVTNLTEKIDESLHQSKKSLCIFIDLCKTFDTVCHQGFLNSRGSLSFRGIILKIMKNYIILRKQRVCINGVMSSSKTIHYTDPQWSVYIGINTDSILRDKFHVWRMILPFFTK